MAMDRRYLIPRPVISRLRCRDSIAKYSPGSWNRGIMFEGDRTRDREGRLMRVLRLDCGGGGRTGGNGSE